jgi:hypothetical protein
MTDNGTTATTRPEETPAVPPEQQPDITEPPAPAEPAEPPEPAEPTAPPEPAGLVEPAEPAEPAEDPGYLVRTGEAVGEDGSVVPIIGGLPAVEGSAWDVGAPLDERGVDLAGEQDNPSEA